LEEKQIGFQDSRRMDGVRAISGLRQYLEQVQNPFVVLDSWEGLFFESHSLGVEEISKLVEDYDARFVVVTERREQTDLDYLLDGVVVLRRKFHEGRVVREIELKKLRGVSIKHSRFLFTLDSGKFRYLPPFIDGAAIDSSKVGEPLAPRGGHFSTGALALDSILGGGFSQGSFNLVETQNDVPSETVELFLRTLFSNFVNNGHQVLFVPFVGFSHNKMTKILTNLSEETIKRYVTILSYEEDSKETQSLKGEMAEDLGLVNKTIHELQKKSNKSVLVVMGQDALEGLYGAYSVSKDMTEWIAALRTSGNIRVQMSSPNAKLLHEMRAFCDTNTRIEMIHGTPVIFTSKPLSELHGIIADPASPGRLGLVPIV
jgi:KaiC/GvpD/RAD55 family RecA-like ATPase